jgi:DNA replicative helicase MCM subunit Mcm2 (Cdc46/Mcm family)
MMDQPDAEIDRKLSNHLVKMHSVDQNGLMEKNKRGGKEVDRDFRWEDDNIPPSTPSSSRIQSESQTYRSPSLYPPNPFSQQFAQTSSNPFAAQRSPLPAPLLRKYINYCRMHCHPRLSEEAKQRLKQYFIDLRRAHYQASSVCNGNDVAIVLPFFLFFTFWC